MLILSLETKNSAAPLRYSLFPRVKMQSISELSYLRF